MTRPTLLDIAKRNLSDSEVGLVEEAIYETPEVSGQCRWTGNSVAGVGQSKPIKGLNYYTRVRTALPSAGFRGVNEGVTAVKSTWENRLVETFILNPRWECDQAEAEANEDGPEAFIAEEADAITKGAFLQLGRQFYYGTNTSYGGHAKGFPGLIDAYDATNMMVDAGGTTANTGSSAWLVKWGPRDTRWVVGNNGSFSMSDIRMADLLDGSSNPFTGYVQEMLARLGLQVANPAISLCRIKKLTADSGKGLTDDLITQAMMKMKIRPDAIFCSRRSWGQLQQSRTATTATGAEAPMPTEVHGIPLMVTDAIYDTESLTL